MSLIPSQLPAGDPATVTALRDVLGVEVIQAALSAPYASQLAGEAGTAAGQYFAVDAVGDTVSVYVRTAGGSTLKGTVNVAGTVALRADLAASTGSSLVGFNDTLAPTYLKTVSDIINGSQVSVHRFIDPTKLSAIQAGTSTYDASANMQAAFDAAALTTGGMKIYYPHGTYLGRNLLISSNTSIDGEGPSSVLKLLSGALDTDVLLRNANPGAYTDFNISIRGMTFNGNDAGAGATQTRFTELLSFGRVINLLMGGSIITNVQYIGMTLGGVHRARIENNQFAVCGFAGATANGGSSCWVAQMGTDSPEDIVFVGNEVHSNRWHGLHFSVRRGVVSSNSFYDNKETHLFGSRAPSLNIAMSDVAIVGNSFNKIRMHDISSHAIEVGGIRLTIAGNMIYDCDHGGIALTDVQHSTVSGNTIGNFNNLSHTLGGGIDLICSGTLTNTPTNITMTGNTIYDDRATVLGRAGIYIHNAGGTAPTNITIHDNPMHSAWTGGKPVLIGAGMMGAGFSCRDNPGNDDTARGCTVYSSVAQTLITGTATTLTFDTAAVNSVDMVFGGTAMWVAAAPTRVTIKEAGRCRVDAGVNFATNASGIRQVVLFKNGTPAIPGGGRSFLPAPGTADYTANLGISSGVIDVVAGDYFEVQALQESGGNLDVTGGLTQTWLSVEVL